MKQPNSENVMNKLLWFLLAAFVTIALSAVGGWAKTQMNADNYMQDQLDTYKERTALLDRELAVQAEKLSTIDSKLDLLLHKENINKR